MSQIGQLSVKITADSTNLESGMKRADKAVRTSTQTIERNIARWAKWGAAASAAAAGVAVALVNMQIKSIDALAKTSDKLGIAIQDLQALRFAAEQSGLSAGTLDMALQRMTRRLSEAAQGTGEAKGALEELGIDAVKLGKMTPDKQLMVLADAMQSVESQSDRVRLAFKFFDSEGVALVNMLQNGSQGLEEFKTQAEALGLTLDRDTAAGVEEANNAIHRMRTALDGASQQITAEIAPIITELADSFVAMANEAGGVGEIIRSVADDIATAIDVASAIIVARLGSSAAAFAAAQVQAVAYQAALARMAGVSAGAAASQTALAASTRALSTAYSLLGGPAGLVALTAFGIYQLSSSYRDNVKAAEERLDKLRQELQLMPQLASAQEEYNRSVNNAYKPLESYTNEVDRLFASQVRGLSQQGLQEQFDKSSASLERAENRLRRYTEAGGQNQSRIMQLQEQVRKYRAELDILSEVVPNITTSEQQQAEAVSKVTLSLEDQIFQLQNGQDAYEDMLRLRAANVDASSKEGQEILALAEKYRALRDEQQKEREREQEQELKKQEDEQKRDESDDYIAQLRERFATEEQLEQEKYAKDQARLKEALAQKAVSYQEFLQLQADLEAEHNEKMAAIKAEADGNAPLDPNSPEGIEAYIKAIEERMAAEEEMELARYEAQLQRLREALEQQKITQEEYNALMEDEDKRHADEMARIKQAEEDAKARATQQGGSGMLAALKSFGEQSTKIQKAVSLAQAGMAIATGIAKAQELGFPANIAEMARVASVGASVASSLKSASVGSYSAPSASGGASRGAVGSALSSSSQQAQQPQRNISINLTGSGNSFSDEDVRALIEQINEQAGDGVTLAVGGG